MSFHAWWVRLSPSSPFSRCLWVSFPEDEDEDERQSVSADVATPVSISIANLPPVFNASHLAAFFEEHQEEYGYGDVVDVKVDGAGHGTVVFAGGGDGGRGWRPFYNAVVCGADVGADPEVVLDSAAAPASGGPAVWLEAYKQKYRRPVDELQASVDSAIAAYDRRVEEEAVSAARGRKQADDDGWVTVQVKKKGKAGGKGRDTHHGGKGITVKAVPRVLQGQDKDKDKVLADFYRFQKQEEKGRAARDLREKFEQDKLKLAEMRRKRKFKPE